MNSSIQDSGLENCNKYMEKYHQCVGESGGKKDKLKECRKILKYYEYCLIRAEIKEKERKG